MAGCNSCGTTILFGGVRSGDLRFCNDKCLAKGYLVRVAQQIPIDVLKQQTFRVYHGVCPKCKGPGPVDVHTSYQVVSLVFVTQWKNTPQVSCRRCGVKSQFGDALISLLAGWWGFPWGIVMTPVQIIRNLTAAFRHHADQAPSRELQQAVSMMMAQQIAHAPRPVTSLAS